VETEEHDIWGPTWTFAGLERRIRALELLSTRLRLVKGSGSRAGQRSDYDRVSLLDEFQELAREATLMKETAHEAGDQRLALACLRESGHVLEIIGRLRGELEGKNSAKILHVNLDADTGKRIAETYLARRKKVEDE
jgi:hypothetical protein